MAVELFEPYPVTGGEIRAAANDTRSRIESIRDLREQLEGAGRDTLAAVEGDLEGSVANAPTEAVTAGDMTIRDAEYAAGCLEYFAQAVDDFNTGRTSDPRSVQALNQAYAEAYDSGFGVSYSMVDDTSPQTFERTHQRYSQLLGHARQAVMGALIREHSRSQDLLEQAAEDVSKMLSDEADPRNVQVLWEAGCLPAYAPIVFPDVDLTGGAAPATTSTEIVDLFLANPGLMVDPQMRAAWLQLGIEDLHRLAEARGIDPESIPTSNPIEYAMALVQLNLLGATGAGGEDAPFYLDSGSEGYDNEFINWLREQEQSHSYGDGSHWSIEEFTATAWGSWDLSLSAGGSDIDQANDSFGDVFGNEDVDYVVVTFVGLNGDDSEFVQTDDGLPGDATTRAVGETLLCTTTGGLGPVCDLTFLSAEALLGEEQESYSVYQGTVVVSAYEDGGTMIGAPTVFTAPIAVNRDPAATDQNAQVELEEGEPPSYLPGYLDTLVIERARDGNDF